MGEGLESDSEYIISWFVARVQTEHHILSSGTSDITFVETKYIFYIISVFIIFLACWWSHYKWIKISSIIRLFRFNKIIRAI